MPENDIFYFHSDHLGSSSYITTINGSISQHVEYIAFGEVLFEEHASSFKTPYLYNGKELDRETNLSYYGARYLDMKTSLWLNVDPLAEKFPNVGSYVYCFNNPINYIDPTGMEGEESKPPFSSADSEKVQAAINYVDQIIGKRNKKIEKYNNKITSLDSKQSGKYSDSRQNRIDKKNNKVKELQNQINVLNDAKFKINYLMNSDNHNFNFQLGSNVGRDMGDNLQEAGNVIWGASSNNLTINTNSSKETLIHELSHVFDVVTNKYEFSKFVSGGNVGFYSERSEVDAYKITYSLGGSMPAPVKNGVNSITSDWFNENLRKNYTKKK